MALVRAFGPDIWLAPGGDIDIAGFRYPTMATLIRLADGTLMAISPVRLTDALRAEMSALGQVSQVVAPNHLHHLFLPDWAAAWPEARLHAAPGLRKKRADIAFHADLTDTPDPAWAGMVEQATVQGCLITREVVFFHRPSRTAIFTDLLQQFPEGWFSGWRATIGRLDLMVGPEPNVPRKFRLAFTGRRAARASVGRILDWPAERVVMAHGAPVERDGRAVLTRAFRWLTG